MTTVLAAAVSIGEDHDNAHLGTCKSVSSTQLSSRSSSGASLTTKTAEEVIVHDQSEDSNDIGKKEDDPVTAIGDEVDKKDDDLMTAIGHEGVKKKRDYDDDTATAIEDEGSKKKKENAKKEEDDDSRATVAAEHSGNKKRRSAGQQQCEYPWNTVRRHVPNLLDNSAQSVDTDRKYLAELEQELEALDSLCAANLLNGLGVGSPTGVSHVLRRRFDDDHRRSDPNRGDFAHSRQQLVREMAKVRFRLSIGGVAAGAFSREQMQQQTQVVASLGALRTTPSRAVAALTTKPPPLHSPWSQMLLKSATPRTTVEAGIKSGKRPHRPDPPTDLDHHLQQQQHQFSGVSITEQGLVHMSVKVPFPDSAIANDGKCQNLIGRILGPRGISVRQLEMQYGCKILIRGKGSVKDVAKEKRLRGKPEGRHLDEQLHVLIEAQELSREQCVRKLVATRRCIEKLMVPVFDEYKRQQLIQLAIINGTYRSRARKDDNSRNPNKCSAGGGGH